MKAKLIFNPASGNPKESAEQLVELLCLLQKQQIQAEVVVVQPKQDLRLLARSTVRAGVKMVIVSGGDGTIENIALGLVGSRTALGIIPTGTRNNLARSLNIPVDNIASAAALLRKGRRIKIDVGQVRQRKKNHPFLEAAAIGLSSALYPASDDIQHGELGKIAGFISTLVKAEPSEIRLQVGKSRKNVVAQAHVVIVANMPYMGANYQIAPDVIFDDHYLDVFVYSDLSKRDLIGQVMQPSNAAPDARIQRFRAKKITIRTKPAMPVMADGVLLGDGSITIMLHPRRLVVMAGPKALWRRRRSRQRLVREQREKAADDSKGMSHVQ